MKKSLFYFCGILSLIISLEIYASTTKFTKSTHSDTQTDSTLAKTNFIKYCAACHLAEDEMVGPALGKVLENRDKVWLIKFIKDSKELKASGDTTAVALEKSNNFAYEHSFKELSEKEIIGILKYIQVK